MEWRKRFLLGGLVLATCAAWSQPITPPLASTVYSRDFLKVAADQATAWNKLGIVGQTLAPFDANIFVNTPPFAIKTDALLPKVKLRGGANIGSADNSTFDVNGNLVMWARGPTIGDGAWIDVHRAAKTMAAGLRFFNDDEPNMEGGAQEKPFFSIGPDQAYPNDTFFAFFDPWFGNDVLKIGMDNSPNTHNNMSFGTALPAADTHININDESDTRIGVSLKVFSYKTAIQTVSSHDADLISLMKAGTAGKAWLHFGCSQYTGKQDWRLGKTAVANVGDFAFYNQGDATGDQSATPGTEVLKLAVGTVGSTEAPYIKSDYDIIGGVSMIALGDFSGWTPNYWDGNPAAHQYGWEGCYFTVGADEIRLKQLGRYAFTGGLVGNVRHRIRIFTCTGVPGAGTLNQVYEVVFPKSSAANRWIWANADCILSANTLYYMMTDVWGSRIAGNPAVSLDSAVSGINQVYCDYGAHDLTTGDAAPGSAGAGNIMGPLTYIR
jgi:hypothetical protein